MMESFSTEPDNPDTALNGLHTLMVYDEESWFLDCTHSYGRRFETHMQVQWKIAEGLCRFGHYEEAATYCRISIVLGGGPRVEELLNLCMDRLEKKEMGHLDLSKLEPESMLRPYAFSMAITAMICIGFTANGVSAMRNHSLWLVSGSAVPYAVEFDGKRYELDPYDSRSIKVRLGEHRMRVHGLPGHGAETTFSYTLSLIRQKLGDHALVLNPDAMALLVEETLLQDGSTNRYRFGNVIHQLKGIDYPFAMFPVWAGSKRTTQKRLFSRAPASHREMVEFLRLNSNTSDSTEYARRVLKIEPGGADTEALLAAAIDGTTKEQAITFLRRGTSIQPPLSCWHIFYQNLVAAQMPEHDLQQEYAALYKAHPDQPLLCYLLGRVARNRDTAHRFFEKSESGQGSMGLGYHAIAYDLLCSGKFRTAQPYVDKALARDPDNSEFKALALRIHLALGQYEPVLKNARGHLTEDPESYEWIAEVVKYQTLCGQHREAMETMNSHPGGSGKQTAFFTAARYYASGNTSDYLECLLASGWKDSQLPAHLHAGRVAEAHELLSQNETHEYTEHLIHYCAAMHHGFTEIAEIELAKAIAETPLTDPALTQVKHLLSTTDEPSSSTELLHLRIEPQEKAILFATLGYRFPAKQEALFSLARKFNHTPEYPQLLLKKWTRKVPAK